MEGPVAALDRQAHLLGERQVAPIDHQATDLQPHKQDLQLWQGQCQQEALNINHPQQDHRGWV